MAKHEKFPNSQQAFSAIQQRVRKASRTRSVTNTGPTVQRNSKSQEEKHEDEFPYGERTV